MARQKNGSQTEAGRLKLSTTISAGNFAFLQDLARRQATTLAAIVDQLIDRVRRAENRRRLEEQTATYYAQLGAAEQAEEQTLESALSQAGAEVDVERE
jgi:hypothetical protein